MHCPSTEVDITFKEGIQVLQGFYHCFITNAPDILEIYDENDVLIYNNNECRTRFNLEKYHYLIQPFDEMFKEHSEYLALYESASADEKPDYSLYYMALVFTDRELSSLNIKKQNANDWEKVELEERIGGLQFAKECLNDAWQKRKGEVQ